MFAIFIESGNFDEWSKEILFVTSNKATAEQAVEELTATEKHRTFIQNESMQFVTDYNAKNRSKLPARPEKPKYVQEATQALSHKNHMPKIAAWQKACEEADQALSAYCNERDSAKLEFLSTLPAPQESRFAKYLHSVGRTHFYDIKFSFEEVELVE